MVFGQISPKLSRREFSIFITFSDTYTCTYVLTRLIVIDISVTSLSNSLILSCSFAVISFLFIRVVSSSFELLVLEGPSLSLLAK